MEKINEIGLEEQKKIQLEILKKVKEICDSNNINFFLGGGTLLGAVRHKGYIPWDDDIDIMMMRTEYERLLEIFDKECNDNRYKLLSYNNDKDYYYPFAKIVDLRTTILEYPYKKIENMGVYIDIFPIDFLPDDDKKINKLYKRYKTGNRIMDAYKVDNIEEFTQNKLKLLLKKPLRWIIQKFKFYKIILKMMDGLGKKYNNTKKVACISGRYFEKEIMPSDYISDYVFLEFEGEKFKAPIGYESYLAKHYGDYMKLPPKEKQMSNHSNVAYWR